MTLKDATSRRIIELCKTNGYTPTRLAELSRVPASTISDLITKKRENPSSLVIHKICKTLNIKLQDFYTSELFDDLDE